MFPCPCECERLMMNAFVRICVCVRKTLGGGATAVTTAVLQSPMMHLGISHSYYDVYSPVLYPLLLSLNTCHVTPHTVPLQMKEDVGCCKVSLFNLATELVNLTCFGNILENMCCWNVNIVKLSSVFHKIVFPRFHLVTLVVHKNTHFTVHHNSQYRGERYRQWKAISSLNSSRSKQPCNIQMRHWTQVSIKEEQRVKEETWGQFSSALPFPVLHHFIYPISDACLALRPFTASHATLITLKFNSNVTSKRSTASTIPLHSTFRPSPCMPFCSRDAMLSITTHLLYVFYILSLYLHFWVI